MKPTRLFSVASMRSNRAICIVALISMILTDLSPLAGLLSLIPRAEAAEVTVTSAENTTAARHIHAGSQTVFVSDDVGYRFFVDSATECSYVKTTNGGASWGGQQKVDDQGAAADCVNISVWYDRWTPGDGGDYVHIVTMDTGSDDLFYNRLDTTNDSLLAGSTAVLFSTAAGYPTVSLDAGANYPSITKSTAGVLYVSIDEATANGSWVFRCSGSCDTASNWSEAGTSPLEDVNDWSTLAPLLNGNVLLINRDLSADDIRTRVWSATSSAWSSSWVLLDGNAIENGTYDVQMSAVTAENGSVYLAYMTDTTTLGTNDDLRTARYSTSWSSTTAIVTNSSRGLTQVAIGLDANTDDVYVAYSARVTAATADTANVYWHVSTNDMSSWGAEQGPVNANDGDLYGVDINNYSNERVYVSWADITNGTIQGDTIADVFGGVLVSATGTQASVVRASTTNFYTGGVFAFTENLETRDISSITITENGTVNGATGISNIRLLYEHDTSAPYNCASVSYNGNESQYGDTDTNGFSGADGVSAFSGTGIVASTTAALCVYVVLNVTSVAADASTLNLSISNPSTDVTVGGGGAIVPETTVEPNSSTTIADSILTQEHYHFRNDNGTETTATSRTGGTEDSPITSLPQSSSTRLRIEVSNEGSTSSLATQLRLEYSEATSTCDIATGWTDVGATDDAFNMHNTSNLTEGNNTTNVSVATGGVTDENTTFLASNGGVRDTTSQTGSLTLATSSFVELEFSIIASTSAPQGTTYCFRLTNAGTPLPVYDSYPRVSITADVRVTATSSQATTLSIPGTNTHIGGTFVITENASSRTVTGITIREQGTVNAQTGLDNIDLRYDLDTSAPYNCASESYSGSEPLFGSTDTDGFSSGDGSSSFTGSVTIDTASTLCVYVELDVTSAAQNGETLDVYILAPSTDVVVTGGGSVSPSIPVDITGNSTLAGAIMTQTHYHFRNDNGSEAAATSLTGGVDDSALTDVEQNDPFRLRMQVSNEGSTSSVPTRLQLEYGTKITTCENIGVWNVVDSVNAAFAMVPTANLTQGANTSNIAEALGGMPDENVTFKVANAAVNDTSAISATTTLSSTEFIEAEFSMQLTTNAGYNTDYCFRLTNAGTALNTYTTYGELSSAPKRDFKVQRGSTTVTGTGVTITAGVDYEAPASSTRAFIRITNTHHIGAGRNAAGGNQNADDVSAYISNPQNLLTSVTFTRPAAAINNTRVDWEIVEYIGDVGGDNEIVVRRQGEVRYGTTDTATSTPTISGIVSDADVVVFLTGAFTPDTALTDYEAVQATASWNSGSDTATFTRGVSGSDAVRLSYAVVEFTGVNWTVQRVEHTYSQTAGTIETENIAAVNSLDRAFIHTQKRMTNGLQSMADFGHEVWLSSIGVLSLRLDSLASTPSGHTSVVWIVENTQLTLGAMEVHRINGSTSAGTEPLTLSIDIGETLNAVTNSSILGNSRLSNTGTNFPQPIAGLKVASTTAIELWRSDTGNTLTYRVEVVEWPVAELAFRQNYYEFYADNGSTTPADAWPPGAAAIGENAAITVSDSPIADGERVRIRMSLLVQNATFPDNNQSFKLQYGRRVSTCSAISSWNDVGSIGSGAIWRGYDNTPADGTTLPSTLLSVSDEAATYEEENDSAVNPSVVIVGDDVEYDWLVQHNGAVQRSDYCFRMTYADGTPLSVYNNYPTIRTAGYTPVISRWRWYTDEASITPAGALEQENSAPSDVVNGEILKLRVSLQETKGANGENVKFGLQYSQYADFSDGGTFLTSTTSCIATSTWCYADAAGVDNATITASVISDSASCIGGVGTGCGTHNESVNASTSVYHPSHTIKEFEFAIRQGIPRVGGVYYFRLYDMANSVAVSATSSYPSLLTEGALLSFAIGGLPSGTSTEGIVTGVTTTPTSLTFGTLPFSTVVHGAHRLTASTNATEGYRIFLTSDQQLTDTYGNTIDAVTGTNATPVGWATGCLASSTGCFGYHAGDDVLLGGSTRFAPDDSYAGLSTGLAEVMYSAVPTAESHDIVYSIAVTEAKEAGGYENAISYIAVPVY